MRKKIAILGSTGSIGKKTLNVVYNNKKKFIISLLTTNNNISEIQKQIRLFDVKNVIIKDYKSYIYLKKLYLLKKKTKK